jgi:hypothetical protein
MPHLGIIHYWKFIIGKIKWVLLFVDIEFRVRSYWSRLLSGRGRMGRVGYLLRRWLDLLIRLSGLGVGLLLLFSSSSLPRLTGTCRNSQTTIVVVSRNPSTPVSEYHPYPIHQGYRLLSLNPDHHADDCSYGGLAFHTQHGRTYSTTVDNAQRPRL